MLELTDSPNPSDSAEFDEVVRQVRGLGVRIAIDNFGTGCNSLGFLRGGQVDQIKIDKLFITRLGDSQPDRKIVRALIDLAHDLGVSVVAEGVEQAEILATLRAWGCDFAQGFHIAHPMPKEELLHWLGSKR